ncbi:MAG: inorganic phosphate transporter [Dehalogenimonas sp.]|uniref:Inorganic phosphate transporter n=1 Tax=Candidatus Dehalogenimonas loeffleri TaxID=3127115 RepID=A0ABZ2J4Q0_9CHLR|nr:inorganic phosphate transporter [Dehalogenimonas sp.]
MPEAALGVLIFIVVLAVGLGFVNGMNDAANAIATVVGTRVLSPRTAIIMAAFANLLGAATGTAVAATIGKGILHPEFITFNVIIAALAAIVIWGGAATFFGLPISLTHGLVSGLAFAGLAVGGFDAVNITVLGKIISAVFTAPMLGFVGAFFLMLAVYWLFKDSLPSRIRHIFSNGQVLSSMFMAYTHGKNDGQMPIGVITMALVIYTGNSGLWDGIPWWVIIVSATAISMGTAIGGWRVMKTLGFRVTNLKPAQGFVAQTGAAGIIELASNLGIPVSTTHSMSAAIMGVGATRRFSAVRWSVAGNILTAWVVTFPACGALAFLVASILKLF